MLTNFKLLKIYNANKNADQIMLELLGGSNSQTHPRVWQNTYHQIEHQIWRPVVERLSHLLVAQIREGF